MPIDPFKDTPNLFELIGQDEQLKEAGQTLEDFLKGAILGNTTDLVGAPVQILGDALNALGVPVGNKPVGGTNWLREQLGQAQPENESLAQTLGSLVGMPDPQSMVALGGIMMGPKSKLWNKDAEDYLEAFEQAGYGKDKEALRQIFEQLNVYRGVDNRVRQEIPDYHAKMMVDGTSEPGRITLGEAINHPELFKAYPKLAELSVLLSPKAADDASAMFARGGLFTDPYIEFNPNSNTAKTDLLHEIQHAIQKIENFAKGGNSAQFEGTAELQKARDYFKQIAPNNAQNISDEALQMMLYRRLAGETESRLIEDRALLPPEMLRTVFPPDVYSVPAENQILNFYKKPKERMDSRQLTPEELKQLESLASPEIMQGLTSAPGFKNRSKTVAISPEEFLALASSEGFPYAPKLEQTRQWIGKEPMQDAPFLMIDNEGKVVGHEGRHRAAALAEQGIPVMPLELRSSNIRWSEQTPDRFDYVEQWPQQLINQDGTAAFDFPIKQDEALNALWLLELLKK